MKTTIISTETLKSRPLRRFSDSSSKADYGKLLIVGGSARLPGAALLSARAALRSGCGTVRVAAPKSVATQLGIACPELMVIPLPETSDGTVAQSALQVLAGQFEACDACVIGPGLDENDETSALCEEFLNDCPLPTVVDASAMLPASTCTHAGSRIWTPHDGEMQALLKREFEAEERPQIALEWAKSQAKSHPSTCALKGRDTFIANETGEVWQNNRGTRGLGTAGSGDVLTGIIGALLAQKHDELTAAIYSVFAHALAGEAAAKELGDTGMMASDFLEKLPFVWRELRQS